MRAPLALLCVLAALPVLTPMTSAQDAPNPLTTRWTGLVSPTSPHPEYPRPTLVRADWLSLNGPWEWEPAPEGMDTPDCNTFSGTILVPFAVESALSGIGRHEERFWCRRAFDLPESWRGQRVLLHFGAVDWEARVWVNGKFVGEHRGGYDPFSFDITDFLVDGAKQAVMVRVADPTDASTQPRGKQVREPHGIWYTPTTGIWQTVWLETVARTTIEAVKVVTELDAKTAGPHDGAGAKGAGRRPGRCGDVLDGDKEIGGDRGCEGGRVGDDQPVASAFRPLWTPDEPHLYGLT